MPCPRLLRQLPRHGCGQRRARRDGDQPRAGHPRVRATSRAPTATSRSTAPAATPSRSCRSRRSPTSRTPRCRRGSAGHSSRGPSTGRDLATRAPPAVEAPQPARSGASRQRSSARSARRRRVRGRSARLGVVRGRSARRRWLRLPSSALAAEWPTPAHGSTSRHGAKTWARARFTPTKATVCRVSPTRSAQKVASVTGMKSPWSSARLSRRLRSGMRWTWPTIRNGGTERSARSLTLGVRSSRIGSTVVSETANRTDARFTWANSARMRQVG